MMFILTLLLSAGISVAQTSHGSLTVEVRDTRLRPVKRVCVTVIPKEGEIMFGQTDGSGRFKLNHLTPGSYRVVVKSGHHEAQKKEIACGSNTSTVTFEMRPRDVSSATQRDQR